MLAAPADAPTRIAAIATAARAMVNNGVGPDAVELLERAALTPDLRTPAVLLVLARALVWTNRRGDALTLAAEARVGGDRDEQALADVLGLYVAIADGAAATVAQLADGLDEAEPRLSPGTQATSRLARCVAGAFELDLADGLAIGGWRRRCGPAHRVVRRGRRLGSLSPGRYAEIPLHGVVRREEGRDGGLASGLRMAASLAAHVERDDPRAAELADAAAAALPVPVFATTVDVARVMWHRWRGEHEAASALLAVCAARGSERSRDPAGARARPPRRRRRRPRRRIGCPCGAHGLQTLAGRAGLATTMLALLAGPSRTITSRRPVPHSTTRPVTSSAPTPDGPVVWSVP